MDKYIENQIISFNGLYKNYDELYQNLDKYVGLPRVVAGVLFTLAEFDSAGKKICTQKDITDVLLYSKQSVNSAIRQLKEKDYITLENIEGNKKSKNVCLTDKGIRLVQEKIVNIVEAENLAFSRFSEQERNEILSLFSRMIETFREEFENLVL